MKHQASSIEHQVSSIRYQIRETQRRATKPTNVNNGSEVNRYKQTGELNLYSGQRNKTQNEKQEMNCRIVTKQVFNLHSFRFYPTYCSRKQISYVIKKVTVPNREDLLLGKVRLASRPNFKCDIRSRSPAFSNKHVRYITI